MAVLIVRNFELPGRSLAAGKRGMAATSHPTATFAAIEALRDGGNAVDAAVAACAAQCVVEAGSTGSGGNCFALLSRGGSANVIAYNGSGRTPAAAAAEWYERPGVESIERHSPHAVTIPGAVEAWARLIKDHGRRPLTAALEPAIELARDGYAISPRVSHDIGTQRDLLRRDRTASRIFLNGGEAPSVGSLQRQPEVRPDPLDIDNLHIEIEATRLAYAARDALLSDPAKAAVPIAYLLSDRLADALAGRLISPTRSSALAMNISHP